MICIFFFSVKAKQASCLCWPQIKLDFIFVLSSWIWFQSKQLFSLKSLFGFSSLVIVMFLGCSLASCCCCCWIWLSGQCSKLYLVGSRLVLIVYLPLWPYGFFSFTPDSCQGLIPPQGIFMVLDWQSRKRNLANLLFTDCRQITREKQTWHSLQKLFWKLVANTESWKAAETNFLDPAKNIHILQEG